ncbi:MAG: hypothetical protein E7331_07995 [Clostridiales bacterium]|nr:hypothetical protein [Clostridiales bacterium]
MINIPETIKAALHLARKHGGKQGLNCIAELDKTAMKQAASLKANHAEQPLPLCGVPVLVKDNIDVRGLHTTAGSLALSDNVAAEDAPVIRNLRRKGAVILGKTNMTEFANYTTDDMPAGYSSRGGQVIHAAHPSLSPSGSSSGSAVAVAAGIVPMAVGTDTSFSVVACAQANGICGLKPPAGALSPEGIIPISITLDSAGSMAKNLTDTLSLYSAMRNEPLPPLAPAPASSLRIAVNTANTELVSEGQLTFLMQTVSSLEKGGAYTEHIRQMPTPYQRIIMQWEFRPHLEAYLRTSGASRKTLADIIAFYEAHPRKMMKYGITLLKKACDETPGGLQGTPYLEALEQRKNAREATVRKLQDYDAVIMTGPTNIMHFCGLPSLCIAGAQTGDYGVRRGLILYGADELRLYRAALAVEKLLHHTVLQ